MSSDKFLVMIGFAKRAGKIVYGLDNLKAKKRLKLLAVSDTASENLVAGMKNLAAKQSLPLVQVAALEEAVGSNCKALGITDENMAREMLSFVSSGAERYKILQN